MRLPVPPRARLLQGLLGLTLLLVAVCLPMKESQSPGAQPGIPLQGDTKMGEQQRLDPGDSAANVSSDADKCDKWVRCNYDFYTKYLDLLQEHLPSCPCTYPAEALDGFASLFDERLGRTFYWKDSSDTEEHVDAYLPAARLCLRSLHGERTSMLASQLCCYDHRGRLLTRGKGARSTELISPYFSPKLHHIVDHVPWDLCKGDWSVFQTLMPPNNGLNCPQRPSGSKFVHQWMQLSKN